VGETRTRFRLTAPDLMQLVPKSGQSPADILSQFLLNQLPLLSTVEKPATIAAKVFR